MNLFYCTTRAGTNCTQFIYWSLQSSSRDKTVTVHGALHKLRVHGYTRSNARHTRDEHRSISPKELNKQIRLGGLKLKVKSSWALTRG